MTDLTRRSLLSSAAVLTVVAATGVGLASCGSSGSKESRGRGDGAGSSEPGSTGAPSASATPVPGSVEASGTLDAVDWDLEVGPAVVTDSLTVVRVVFSSRSEEPVSIGATVFGEANSATVLGGIRMTRLAQGLCYRECGGDYGPVYTKVAAGERVELYPVFPATEASGTVELILPNLAAVVGVPVVAESQAPFDVDAALAKAEPEVSGGGPSELDVVIAAADGSSDTAAQDEGVAVTVSGDVTFEIDSAELSDQADTVLRAVTAEIAQYPSGGALTVTGHTDNVGTSEHNQTLSEQRARSVSDRLAALTDLSAWEVAVAGKGETEPRVDNDTDAHKAVNRRVEVLVTPKDPTEGKDTATPDTGQVPDAKGPTASGTQGVDVDLYGTQVHVSMDKVLRIGSYLLGELVVTSAQPVTMQLGAFELTSPWIEVHWAGLWFGVSNPTLLVGGTRYLLADAKNAQDQWRPLAPSFLPHMVAGDTRRLQLVWPDTGQDSVIVDMPGGPTSHTDSLLLRLTDIPVVAPE